MADILLNDDAGYYDFSFENGDFALTYGMDTALLMSVFMEKRADASEMPQPEMRRGWWGNTVLNYDNYEIGSKLWLLEQARKDNTALSLAKTFTQDCLQWLIADSLVNQVKTDSSFIVDGVEIEVSILTTANKTINRSYELWNNTNII